VSVVAVDIALSPLFHLPLGTGSVALVIGPKLGFWALSESDSAGGQTASATANGYVFGANAGVFGNVTPSTAIGGLLSFQGRSWSKACATAPGSSENCTTSGLPDADKVLGINGAVMF
jgi:hypothetical protein